MPDYFLRALQSFIVASFCVMLSCTSAAPTGSSASASEPATSHQPLLQPAPVADPLLITSQASLFGVQAKNASYARAVDAWGQTVIVGAYGVATPDQSANGAAYSFIHNIVDDTWRVNGVFRSPNPQLFHDFGCSVATNGTWSVVGEPSSNPADKGQVHVYHYAGVDGWSYHSTVTGESYDFGRSVAIDSTQFLVGDPSASSATLYTYDNVADVWQAATTLTPPAASGGFGRSVALEEPVAVVGAPYDSTIASSAGAVFAYRHSNGVWSAGAKITRNDGAANDNFGGAVATAGGNTIVIGDKGNGVGGRAHVYALQLIVPPAGYAWLSQAVLTPSAGGSDQGFGADVDISGSTVVVGADGEDVSSQNLAGSVYVFTKNANVWTESAHLVSAAPAANEFFGQSVALEGGILLAGAPGFDGGQGAVRAYQGAGASWTLKTSLACPDSGKGDSFGTAVALDASADIAVVGAPLDDVYYVENGLGQAQGTAYLFNRNPDKPDQWLRQQVTRGGPGDHLGTAVAVAANVAVVGAPSCGDAKTRPGCVHVFKYASGSWSYDTSLPNPMGLDGDRFGAALAWDGSSLVVSAPGRAAGGKAGAGMLFVYTYASGAFGDPAPLNAATPTALQEWGVPLALGGSTLVVGCPRCSGSRGSAFLFTRSQDAFTPGPELVGSDSAAKDRFGAALGIDVTGAILAVGAPNRTEDAHTNAGAVYVFTSNGKSFAEETKLVAPTLANNLYLGSAVTASPNLIGVGVPGTASPDNTVVPGAAYVYYRNGQGAYGEAQPFSFSSTENGLGFGSRMVQAGETWLLGVPSASSWGTQSGIAHLFQVECADPESCMLGGGGSSGTGGSAGVGGTAGSAATGGTGDTGGTNTSAGGTDASAAGSTGNAGAPDSSSEPSAGASNEPSTGSGGANDAEPSGIAGERSDGGQTVGSTSTPSGGSSDDSGCGCRAAGSGPGRTGGLIALLVCLGVGRRRRATRALRGRQIPAF